MDQDLVCTDNRLLYFCALDHAATAGGMPDEFIRKEKHAARTMSFAFAKRYYTLVHVESLRLASQCVLGIVNLGLCALSKDNLDTAARLLIRRGSVEIFREGWTLILNLVRHAGKLDCRCRQTDYEMGREFAELFSTAPGRSFYGYADYQSRMLMLYHMNARQRQADLHELF